MGKKNRKHTGWSKTEEEKARQAIQRGTQDRRQAHATESTTSPKVWQERRARTDRSWAAKAGPVEVRKIDES